MLTPEQIEDQEKVIASGNGYMQYLFAMQWGSCGANIERLQEAVAVSDDYWIGVFESELPSNVLGQ